MIITALIELSQNAVDVALNQVDSYLKQWTEFADASCTELDVAAATRLENLAAELDTLTQSLASDMLRLESAEREATVLLTALTNDIDSLMNEANTIDTAQQHDIEKRKRAMNDVKKKTLLEVSRSIQQQKRETSNNIRSNLNMQMR